MRSLPCTVRKSYFSSSLLEPSGLLTVLVVVERFLPLSAGTVMDTFKSFSATLSQVCDPTEGSSHIMGERRQEM